MEDQAQTSVLPVASNDTDDLFVEADDLGDGESTPVPPDTDSANQAVPKTATQFVIKAAIQHVTETKQPKNISAKHSCLLVFIYFCSVFFVSGGQFLSVMDNM